MCSSPKVSQPKEKKPAYLSNPYLDGMRINGDSQGRNSLVVEANKPLGGLVTTPSVPRIQDPTPPGLRIPTPNGERNVARGPGTNPRLRINP